MPWDFMYPRGYHPRRPDRRSSKRAKCLECRAEIGTAKVNGHRVHLIYCQKHYCARMLPGGTICTQKNNGRSAYCDSHGRCQATGEEGRCLKMVQEDNPEKFRWCKDHGCSYPTCPARRTDPTNPNCPLHRCARTTCDKPRQLDTASFYCELHTCEATTCSAEVDGKGDPGDPSRSCDHHRRCAATGCTRRCHARDDHPSSSENAGGGGGVTGRYCGAHYCHADACDRQRHAGSDKYCGRHLCLEPGCLAGRKNLAGGGRFCADHQCRAEGCVERRDPRRVRAGGGGGGGSSSGAVEHCALHLCTVEGCVRPAAEGRSQCENHRYCNVEGCREWIYITVGTDGEVRYPECEKHHLPRCLATTLTGAQCDRRINPDPAGTGPGANTTGGSARWCDEHACGLRSCPNPRPPDSLQYCGAHRCGAAGGRCQEQVRGALALPASALLDGPLRARLLLAQAGGGRGLGLADLALLGALGGGVGAGVGVAGGSRFCAAHSCQGDGGTCGAEVAGAEAVFSSAADGGAGGGAAAAAGGRRGRSSGRWDRGREEPVRFCVRHECSHRGCRAEATHQSRRSSRGALCDRHYRKRRDEGVCGGGGGGFGSMGGMPMPMPMPMPMGGFPPPFFGGPMYDSSDSSSGSEDGMGPRGLPFGGPFF